ncbi:MAG: cation transporter, partial [Thermotogota bacterium]|nr:cation transporter [Thermotogota bacterium]
MIRWLIKKTIRDYTATSDKKVRESYGWLAGTLGIICNLFLFAMKLAIGLKTSSIAILSDGFNNLTDLGSATVSLLG